MDCNQCFGFFSCNRQHGKGSGHSKRLISLLTGIHIDIYNTHTLITVHIYQVCPSTQSHTACILVSNSSKCMVTKYIVRIY